MSSTNLFNADATMWFSQYHSQSIFLSPHSDDVCFSLGGLIAGCQLKGKLITLFSESVYTRQMPIRFDKNQSLKEVVTNLRRTEDKKFASSQGFSRIDFGFPEPAVRGIRPFGSIDKSTLESLRPHFLNYLIQHAIPVGKCNKKPILFSPLGVGKHVDHLWVRECVARNIKLLSKFYQVAFYEELPYACVPNARNEALTETRKQLQIPLTQNLTWKCSGESLVQKLASIQLYKSQIGVFPTKLQGADELVWLVNE